VVIRGSEFPLDAYETIQMVLTHKNRLRHFHDLMLDLPGAQYSCDANGVFGGTLFLRFNNRELRFDYHVADVAGDRYGSASGFLPQ
jgi:hypothetical protein